MSWFLTNLLSSVLLIPANLLILGIFGLLLWNRRPVTARILLTTFTVLVWIFSTPIFSEFLLHTLEDPGTALTKAQLEKIQSTPAEAIVVLGGGIYPHAPEYESDTVSMVTLQRIRYAVKLARQLNMPLLVSGGTPTGSAYSEAALMKQVLETEYSFPVKWVETVSDNTFQSAANTYQILQAEHINRILLVTQAWHMPRAVRVFQSAGFEVLPAPTAFTTRYKIDLLAFIPDAGALLNSRIYLHEIIGALWYRLKS